MSFWNHLAAVAAVLFTASAHAELPFGLSEHYQSKDTLAVGEEPSEDARDCLNGLVWTPARFEVDCEPPSPGQGDVRVRYASPIPSGDALIDRVAMEWYVARDTDGDPITSPAIVVVHESGREMAVGRLMARGLQGCGFHTFLIQLPHYGHRRREDQQTDAGNLVTTIRQAVADVRRARDAVRVLPMIDDGCIALQGTSLGGFVATTAACLDESYDQVFLLLAGGHLYDMIQNGKKDTAKARERLAEAGLSGEKLKALVYTIEPTRVAHRLDADRTWLYSAKYDEVVPRQNTLALLHAAGLDEKHHMELSANHYSGILFLPVIFEHMRQQITESSGKK